MKTVIRINAAILALLFSIAEVQAHAFIDHSDPAVGAKIAKSPAQVKIWFTEALEGAFSSIKVQDAAGKEVQQGKAQTDKGNPKLFQVTIPALAPGTYKVVWRAVSVDTHVTTGNFTFTIAP